MSTKTQRREKQRTIPVHLIHDNTPTPERALKSDFSPGRPVRVRTTVQSLLSTGDIEQDAANAAERWYRDWAFAYGGVIEFPENHEPDDTTRHDDVSWLMVRAHAVGRLADVRQALGLCAEIRLRHMLVDELPFRELGRVLYPRLGDTQSRSKVAAQCALVLEQLSEFYAERKRSSAERIDACRHV